MNYYNEHDPKAAAWLRELIKAGLIAEGVVDERDIRLVQPGELAGFVQCHFFAGIGGWSYALRLAGWPDDKPVWSGSCPCQPFSAAGKGLGESDERHLWPDFRNLIGKCRPATVFGEQVASKIALGWIAGIQADLENAAYSFGAADLCAAGVGSPNIRQRFFWVADTQHSIRWPELETEGTRQRWAGFGGSGRMVGADLIGTRSGPGWLADAECPERRAQLQRNVVDGNDAGRNEAAGRTGACSKDGIDGLEYTEGNGREQRGTESSGGGSSSGCSIGGLADARSGGSTTRISESKQREERNPEIIDHGGEGTNFWSRFDLIPCRDGKSRRVESGTFPLANGIPGRVGLLRGYGNAINPIVAAEFIRSYCEAREQMK